jgi:fatty-acyl-CoA synthase
VVPKAEYRGDVTAEEIRSFLADRVAKWWLPDEVRFIDEVPKTSTLKFDKKALRATAEPIAEGVAAEAEVRPG